MTVASPIADGVMAATQKLVQQAMRGQWQEVPKTIEERRLLLDQLNATASPQDQQWLGALRQAMAESDAVVAKITESSKEASTAVRGLEAQRGEAHNAAQATQMKDLSATVGSTLEWLNRGR